MTQRISIEVVSDTGGFRVPGAPSPEMYEHVIRRVLARAD